MGSIYMHGSSLTPLYPFSLYDVVPSYPNLTSLDSPFYEEEVKKALFALAKGKASGPNAFPSEFYQVFRFPRLAYPLSGTGSAQPATTALSSCFDLSEKPEKPSLRLSAREEYKRGSKQSRGSVLWDSDAISPLDAGVRLILFIYRILIDRSLYLHELNRV